jgi:signal transduction histidine kinase
MLLNSQMKVPNNNEIVVSISDTRHGIDSEILPRLFTKFATKSTAGTGLGLFISKSIIDAHAGKIWGKNKIIVMKVKELRLYLAYLCTTPTTKNLTLEEFWFIWITAHHCSGLLV